MCHNAKLLSRYERHSLTPLRFDERSLTPHRRRYDHQQPYGKEEIREFGSLECAFYNKSVSENYLPGVVSTDGSDSISYTHHFVALSDEVKLPTQAAYVLVSLSFYE